MDEQERPTTDSSEGSGPTTTNRALMAIGVIFLVVGAVQFFGPADGGVAFLVIGFLFLTFGGARSRR